MKRNPNLPIQDFASFSKASASSGSQTNKDLRWVKARANSSQFPESYRLHLFYSRQQNCNGFRGSGEVFREGGVIYAGLASMLLPIVRG